MKVEEFAAARRSRLERADEELHATVRRGMSDLTDGQPDWDADIITDAAVLWLEIFEKEAPEANRGVALARFRREISKSLEKTAVPDEEGFDHSVNRVTRWLSGYTVNNATIAGALRRGVKFKRWTDMNDAHVREMHAVVDGQIVPIGGTFEVGGHKLSYPGEPVGPPEVWIECRCLAMPAARDGEIMSATTYTIGPEDALEDNPDIIPGSDAFDVQQPDADVASGAVVEWTDEMGTRYYGPFDTAENAQAWIESDGAPFDGESRVIGLVDVPNTEPVIAAAGVDDPYPNEEEGDGIHVDEAPASTEVPVHGVLAPEGVATGDGREFAIGALSTRTLPVPLRYEIVGSHGGDTSQVVTVGRIDEAWRNDDTNEWEFRGVVILSKPHAAEALAGIRDGSGRGVSIDGDDAEIQQEEFDEDSEIDIMEALFGPSKTVFSKMRVAGLTIVAIPAFQEAYIALGHDFREVAQDEREKLADEGAAMPDGSYPIANCEDLANAIQAIGRASDPDATKRHIRRRKSALGCDEVELPEDWSAVVQASAVARLVEPDYPVYPAEWFSEPTVDHAYPLKIDRENRRVHGYISEWGVCHVGMAGMCQEVPRSYSDYAYFKKGVVDTTEGEQFVGNLTWGGHAAYRASMAAASEFYDKPDAVRAFVNVGENAYGVWFAGIIPPDVSDEDITKMRAIGAVSGDWREVRGQLELIGVPIVNTPGLPVRQMAASFSTPR